MTKKLFSFFPLILILLFAFAIRWWQIGSVAPGISGDEVDYSLTAKSFYLTGTDLKNVTHTLDVLKFQYPKTDDTKAELPYLIQLPFDGPFPFSLPLTRFPFVLMSVGSVLLLYLIAKELVDKKTGIIASLLASINPFLVVLGRTNYEVTGATFFFLLSLFALMKLKGWKILFALPVLLCAFYVYIGTKLLFIPFVLLAVGFVYFSINKRKFTRQYLVLLGLLAIFVGVYILILKATPTNRLGELLFPNSKEIIDQVNSIRHLSIPSSLNSLIVNKYTIYVRTIINSFFIVFSNDYLVGYGDNFLRLYNHGAMYYVDMVFLVSSIVFFAKKNARLGLYLLGFIIVATLPHVLHDQAGNRTNYAHASLIFPFLVLIASIGIGYILSLFPKKIFPLTCLVIFLAYLFSFGIFAQAYFFQYPLQGRDDFATRELSKYITLATAQGKKVAVLSPVGATYFKKYLFYSNTINARTIQKVKHAFISSHPRIDTVSFDSCQIHPTFPKDTIVIEDRICGHDDFMPHTTISLIVDGGIAFKLYGDSVCAPYSLKQYPTDLLLSDLEVESLSEKKFCETFITQ